MRWVLRVFWGLVLTAFSSKRAAADPVSLELDWRTAPNGLACLASGNLERRVEAQLGHRVFVPKGSAAVELDVSLSSTSPPPNQDVRIGLELRRDGDSLGSRVLTGRADHCGELLDSLVVVVTLLVDVAQDDPSRAVANPVATELRPAESPSRQVPAPVRGPTHRSRQLNLDAHASLFSGIEPGSAGGFGVGSRFAFAVAPKVALRASADYLPRDRLAAACGRLTFRMALFQLGVAPLRVGSLERFNVEPWLVTALAGVHVQGRGFQDDRAGVRWIPLVGITPRASIPVSGRWSFTVGVGLWIPVLRPRFLYRRGDGAEQQLARINALLPSAELGSCWRFW